MDNNFIDKFVSGIYHLFFEGVDINSGKMYFGGGALILLMCFISDHRHNGGGKK